MQRKTTSIIGAAVAAAGLTFGAISFANADSSTTAQDGTTAGQSQGRDDETPLTGDDAQRATAAALQAVPDGTVLRVETDGDGNAKYEAHVQKADGTQVVVYLDENFTVVSTEEFAGGRGHGGPGRNETPLTGAAAESATAAAQQAVPDGTVMRVESDDDGTYEAHVRKSDGTMVEVKMDANFAVTSVEEHTGRGPGGRHGRGADDADDTEGTDDSAQSSSFDA